MPPLCDQLMCTRTECESYNISPLRALKVPCPEAYAYWVIRVPEVRVVYHFIGWRARRLKGVHRSGLAGVAAMRHRTMDVGPARSTIDWSILSQGVVRSRDRLLLCIPISIVIMTISFAGLSFAQIAQPPNDKETTQASPSRDQTASAESQAQINVNWLYGSYVPKNVPLTSLDPRMRWKLYLRQTYTTPGIYIKTLLFATHDQVTDSNPEWGDDFQGFVKRLGNRQVQFIIQNSVLSLGNGIAGWEPRYDRCRCDGFWPRTRHAMVRNFVTYDRTEISLRPQLMPYLGAFGAASIASTWAPGHARWEVQGYQAAITQVFVGMGINWIGEFAPEIGKVLKRKKR